MDQGAVNYLARLGALDEEAEIQLLNAILTGGFDQGCFLRPDQADLLALDPATTDGVFSALDARGLNPRPTETDPHGRWPGGEADRG